MIKQIIFPLKVNNTCPICGKHHFVIVDECDFADWYGSDKSVQAIFPYLSAEEREFFISGICADCCKNIFKEI